MLDEELLKKAINILEDTHYFESVDGYSGDVYLECQGKGCYASKYAFISDHWPLIMEEYRKLENDRKDRKD